MRQQDPVRPTTRSGDPSMAEIRQRNRGPTNIRRQRTVAYCSFQPGPAVLTILTTESRIPERNCPTQKFFVISPPQRSVRYAVIPVTNHLKHMDNCHKRISSSTSTSLFIKVIWYPGVFVLVELNCADANTGTGIHECLFSGFFCLKNLQIDNFQWNATRRFMWKAVP